MNKGAEQIYLDYAAATPVRAEIVSVMQSYWTKDFANSQSVHQPGRAAAAAITDARDQIAEALSVQSSELVFTSGATESNSLALLGTARAAKREGKKPEVLLSEIAHASVLNITKSHDTVVSVKTATVDDEGRLDPLKIYQQLTPNTVLVSCSHANSEIGTLQPTREVATVIRKWRKENDSPYPLLHVDASQTALYKNIRPESLGSDLLTLNSSKMYGPKGVGVLWIRSGTPVSPVMLAASDRQVGDYQKLRAGTPPTPLIVGFAESLSWAQKNHKKHAEYARKLQEYLILKTETIFPNTRINGSRDFRVPHNVSLTFPDTDHDFLAAQLAAYRISAATTSACQSNTADGSHVLRKIGGNQALRLSFGLETTTRDLDTLLKTLKDIRA